VNLYLDIETIPSQDPQVRADILAGIKPPATYKKPESIAEWMREHAEAAAEAEWLNTSFDGGAGQIVVIGWAVDSDEPQSVQVENTWLHSEAQMLSNFFAALTSLHSTSGTRPVVIGHNHVAFDLPFLWKRAMVHNVKPPLWFPRNPKPWSDGVVDTMTLWDSQQRAGGSMDRLCRILGIPGKDGMSGADVWPAVRDGMIDGVAAYCRDDVWRTRELYKRMMFA
jgi:3'-5' exonuclease